MSISLEDFKILYAKKTTENLYTIDSTFKFYSFPLASINDLLIFFINLFLTKRDDISLFDFENIPIKVYTESINTKKIFINFTIEEYNDKNRENPIDLKNIYKLVGSKIFEINFTKLKEVFNTKLKIAIMSLAKLSYANNNNIDIKIDNEDNRQTRIDLVSNFYFLSETNLNTIDFRNYILPIIKQSLIIKSKL